MASLKGTSGNDRLISTNGDDTMTGAGGSDTFVFSSRPIGNDVITDFVHAVDKIDLSGIGVADIATLREFMTDDGTDTTISFTWNGAPENITIQGLVVSQLLSGDFIFASSTNPIVQTATGSSNLFGGAGADSLTGGVGDDTIRGGGGNDVLVGGAGDDDINGGNGADTLIGSAGDDMLTGGAGTDRFTYSVRGFGMDTITDFVRGTDKLDLSAIGVSDLVSLKPFMSQSGANTVISLIFNGLDESITLAGVDSTQLTASDFVFTTAVTPFVQTATAQSILFGGPGDDVLTASGDGDTLIGGAGNDVLTGGIGDDLLTGGAGNDRFAYVARNFGNDQITDFVIGQDRIDLSTLRVADFSQIQPLLTQFGADTTLDLGWNGNPEVIVLKGVTAASLTAASFVFGSDATPVTETASDSSVMFGGQGNDTLTGSGADDRIYGSVGNDVLSGGDGFDTIDGGAGNDRIEGGLADDLLTGGAGSDTFVFSARGFGTDTITDFAPGQDRIDVAALGVTEFSQIAALMTGAAGGTTIGFVLDSTDDSIVVSGIQPGQFSAGDFVFSSASAPLSLTASSAATLLGAQGDDTLTGSGEGDRLLGGGGVDRLTGGLGNDTIDGGSNVDTAIFAGLRSAYTVTQTSTGVFSVVGPDGTDTLSNVEFAQFDDQTVRLTPGSGTVIDFSADDPAKYMAAIRDFDGFDLGSASAWKRVGSADVNGDGRADNIFVNKLNGRFAEVGTAADGKVYFDDHGWAGQTRVVGIYIDPLVTSGDVVKGGPFDSQRRFQNDLLIDNIGRVLGGADYDHDGLQEVYFKIADGTAYLHAYMHADGNIRYANYQNQQQVIDYLTNNGWAASTYDGWFV